MRVQAMAVLQPVEQPTTEEGTNRTIAWFQEHVDGQVVTAAGRKYKVQIVDYDEDAPDPTPETYFIACGDCEKTYHNQPGEAVLKSRCPECGSARVIIEREGQ